MVTPSTLLTWFHEGRVDVHELEALVQVVSRAHYAQWKEAIQAFTTWHTAQCVFNEMKEEKTVDAKSRALQQAGCEHLGSVYCDALCAATGHKKGTEEAHFLLIAEQKALDELGVFVCRLQQAKALLARGEFDAPDEDLIQAMTGLSIGPGVNPATARSFQAILNAMRQREETLKRRLHKGTVDAMPVIKE